MMRVVSPYLQCQVESAAHRKLGDFDWIAAYRMMADSVSRSCGCDSVMITDLDSEVSVPALRYRTEQTRLMLWILEVSLRYLQSDDFDRDTIMVSPDTLICKDLSYWFGQPADLSLIVRTDPSHHERPILNSVQFWRVRSRDRLVAFYEQVLALACTLPEPILRWGADSEPFRQLCAPIQAGLRHRSGLVVEMIDSEWIFESLGRGAQMMLAQGVVYQPRRAILDFKGKRKLLMAQYVEMANQSLAVSA